MKILVILFTALLFTTSNFACLNYYYGVDKHGHTHLFEESSPAPGFNKNFNTELMEGKLLKLLPQIQKTGDFKLLSDYAVLLLKAGQHKLSLDILQVLYHNHPDQYQLAANLGTAFEINGNLDSAIFYINRGMELNADAHHGSEWVHIKVLETKKALLEDANYLQDNSVLSISEEEKEKSEVREQIMIQAQERFPFTSGPDAIMASILLDLGDCYANTESIEYAKALYKLAKSYYGADDEIVSAKIKDIDILKNKHKNVTYDLPVHEGMPNKIGTIKDYKMLDDNNTSGYEIDWSKLNVNLNELIDMVHLELLPEPIVQEVQEIKILEDQKEVTEKVTAKEEPSNFVFYLLGGVLVLILIGVFVKRRKSA